MVGPFTRDRDLHGVNRRGRRRRLHRVDTMTDTLWLTDDADANALLSRSRTAVLVGALLDQQVPMEWAFAGPYTIASRMGTDDVDVHAVAESDLDRLEAVFATKPAVHRYPSAMAKRVQALCAYLVEHYDGDVNGIWRDVASGDELRQRLEALPGFGRQKAQVFTALLGKQLGIAPQGWREAAGGYGDTSVFRSIADVTGPESLDKVRQTKKASKRRSR